ncbi:MAG TPA: type II secretion system protein GspM [Myxococcota bacterium]|nr:type II secretion system protein GspM [Myxococcota bacterium]
MAKFFEKITDTATQWYDSLTDRERRLLSIVFAVVCVLIIFSAVFIATSKISKKKTLLTHSKEQLAEIKDLESEYVIAKQKHERELQRIKRNDISLFTFIQGITSRLGLTVKDLTEQKRTLGKTNIVEVSVRVSLNRLSIDKVSHLLDAIESPENGGQVKVTRLKINKRHDEPDLLDLQMTVSTWKSA